MTSHAMIDIETLGTSVNAPIISIGAQVFDLAKREIHKDKTFHVRINIASAMEKATPDASTIVWWMQQSEQARSKLFNATDQVSTADAIHRLCCFLNDNDVKYVWGNSARFDLGILETAIKKEQFTVPWEHWNERCYRTIKNFAPGLKIKREGTHHDALDDARGQTAHLLTLFDYLGLNHD